MKFLCLNMWLEEVCRDNTNDNDDDAKTTHDRQSMILYGSLVDKPNEPKSPFYRSDLDSMTLILKLDL